MVTVKGGTFSGLSGQIPSLNPDSSGLHGDDTFCLVAELLAEVKKEASGS